MSLFFIKSIYSDFKLKSHYIISDPVCISLFSSCSMIGQVFFWTIISIGCLPHLESSLKVWHINSYQIYVFWFGWKNISLLIFSLKIKLTFHVSKIVKFSHFCNYFSSYLFYPYVINHFLCMLPLNFIFFLIYVSNCI